MSEIPAYATVYRCLQPGRTRLDVDLVVDIVATLLGSDAATTEWRYAYQRVVGEAADAIVVSVTAQLPDDVSRFAGRVSEMEHLRARFAAGVGAAGPITAIAGMAGVGKTTLAVHMAHELTRQEHFADLQLSVNLRGYDPERPPADPSAVLDGFLRILGISGDQIAGLDLEQRSSKYRELLADRSALVLLDNAASEDQVRPLLPANSTCLTFVTSRRRLDALPSAHHLPLGVLPLDAALELLGNTIGADRIAAEPKVAAEIASMVGYLPLALALTASRIQATPDWTLRDHAERLAERRDTLRLDDGVELALNLSYQSLPADHQRLLRLISLHPGRDFDTYAAAALCDTDVARATQRMAELVASNLLVDRAGRFELHDLTRTFARNRAQDEDAPGSRLAGLRRLLDYYRWGAATATDRYAPADQVRRPAILMPLSPTVTFLDREDATRWLDIERTNLVS